MVKQFRSRLSQRKLYIIVLFFISLIACKSQPKVNSDEVKRIITTLSSDEMQGREVFTPGIDKAADFIKDEFKKIGLQQFAGKAGYEDTFSVEREENGILVKKRAKNIIGIIPGKTKADEYVIFSSHYDHIGYEEVLNGDSIANGADDDASGTTAVITLADFFKRINNNERTLVFTTFTAEEIGGYGSQNFAKLFDPSKIVAMFNIEMIGKESKFGENTAYITGFDKSDLGAILQKNVSTSKFSFHPDPYPEQDLFYRSDNATLAKLGVPAHTIATVQIDKDIYYHTVDDELETINIQNLVNTIEAIIKGTSSIVKGIDTPSRIASE
jgi:Zn-dependent M28 family amino/carboxypeptidase